jgi:hypothetical protein
LGCSWALPSLVRVGIAHVRLSINLTQPTLESQFGAVLSLSSHHYNELQQQLSRRLAARDSRHWAVIQDVDGVARGIRPHLLGDVGSFCHYETCTRLTYSVAGLRDPALVSRVSFAWLEGCTNHCEDRLDVLVDQYGVVVDVDEGHVEAMLHLDYTHEAQKRRSKARLV